jgi:hypothetical protein
MGDALATVSADRNALAELEDYCPRRKNGGDPRRRLHRRGYAGQP